MYQNSYILILIFFKKHLTKTGCCYIMYMLHFGAIYGGIAQMARAFGSYPECRWFKSNYRYHIIWPGGQAAKTPPFHGGNTSSILVRVTNN